MIFDSGVFRQRLADASEAQLQEFCERYIWLSAYAANNPRSEYHQQCDLCYDECVRRSRVDVYERAHRCASGQG